MNEKKPSDPSGGKFPANGSRASKGLALAEFIDAAGTASRDDAPVQGSLRAHDVGPIPPPPAAIRPRLDIVLMEHPLAFAASSAIFGFALGVVASAALRSIAKSRSNNDFEVESPCEIFAVETDLRPRGGI